MTDWQPIDTAPKDGTPILVWNAGYVAVMCWWERCWEYANGIQRYWPRADEREPTHWMPLPDAPA